MLPIATASPITILLFYKLEIIDPLMTTVCAETWAERQEEQASWLKDKTASYEQVLKRYQTETRTQPRLSGQADPMKYLWLIEDELLANARVSSFTISSPVVTVKLSGAALSNIPSICQQLMSSGMAENVRVYIATTDRRNKTVTTTMTVTLAVGEPAAAPSGKKASSREGPFLKGSGFCWMFYCFWRSSLGILNCFWLRSRHDRRRHRSGSPKHRALRYRRLQNFSSFKRC